MLPGFRKEPAPQDARILALGLERATRRLLLSFLMAIVVLPAVLLWATYRTERLSNRIVAIEDCRLLADRALSYVTDEQSGVQAFLDTRAPQFLQPERTARPELAALLRIMPERFAQAGFEDALADLQTFARAHADWQRRVAQPLLAHPNRSDSMALEEAGKTLMNRMHTATVRMHARGAALAAQAAKGTSQTIDFALATAAVWILLVAAFTIVVQRRAGENQRRVFASLLAERESVARLSEWRARLLAMLAHDFKSQLTVLVGASHLLEDFPQRRGDTELLSSLRSAAYALTEMADNAILLARVQERKVLPRPTAFDIGEVVDQVIQRYGAEREFHLHRASPTAIAYADRSYTARVLDNVIGNAVKYSDQPIHVYLLDADDRIAVSVVDRGIGIAADELPHVFEEFWRSERVSWRRGGSGVGLFIVKTIMEAHGGGVDVQSELGKGTTVSLRFPRAQSAFPAETTAELLQPRTTAS